MFPRTTLSYYVDTTMLMLAPLFKPRQTRMRINTLRRSCARGDTICPASLPPCGRRSASRRRADRRACRRQRSSSFPRSVRSHADRCSCLCVNGLVTLAFDLLTLKVVSESRATWPTCMPILVFLDLSVLDLFPMYATDRP